MPINIQNGIQKYLFKTIFKNDSWHTETTMVNHWLGLCIDKEVVCT